MTWPPAWLTPVSADALARSDGDVAVQFAEAYGSIGKDGIAGRAGQALRMRDWQVELLRHLYARDESGGYVARTALVGIPRKNGKSALSSAAIALYSLIAEGIDGAEVIIAAATKEQARIVFGEAKRMVQSSELADEITVYRDSLYVPETQSVLRVIASESFSAEGLNISKCVIDELHAHRDRSLFDVLSLSMGNRGSLAQLVAITTAGLKHDISGGESIAYQLYQYGKKLCGERPELVDPSFFMAWWEAPESLPHDSPEAWRIANPAFGDLVSEADFKSVALTTPEAEFRTKRLNQFTNVKQAWLPVGVWENLASDDVELEPGDEYVIGFDGSWKNDCTSACMVIKPRHEGDVYRVKRVAHWEKDFAIDDDSWVVDKQAVVNEILTFVQENPGCVELVADVSYWQDEIYQWAQAGLPVVEFPQTLNRLVPATAKLYEGIMSGKIAHDGDGVIARHMANCILKMDSRGGSRLTKDYRNPRQKIDMAISLLMAFDRASVRIDDVVPQFFG